LARRPPLPATLPSAPPPRTAPQTTPLTAPRLSAPALSLLACVGLGLLVIALGAPGARQGSAALVTSSAFACLAGAGFCILATYWRRAGLLEIVVGYFFAFGVGVVALYQSRADRFPWPEAHSWTGFQNAMLLSIAALGFWTLGMALARPRPSRAPSPARQQRYRRCCYAGLALSALVITAGNGWAEAFTPRFRIAEASGLSTQLLLSARGIALASLLALVVMRRSRPGQDIPRWLYLLCLLYGALLFNPVGNPRFVFLGYLLAMLCARLSGWQASPRLKAAMLLLFAFGNFFLFGALKAFGIGVLAGWDRFVATLTSDFAVTLYTPDFDVPQLLANGMTHVERFGSLPLGNLAGFFLFFVPRSLWPDKPLGSSFQTMGDLNYGFLNLSYPLYLDLYTAGGALVLGLGMTALGYGFARTAERARQASARGDFSLAAVLYCLAFGFAPILLRGPVNSVIAQFGMAFYWLLAMRLLSCLVWRRPGG
jgi:hypothetical protein